MSVAIIGAGISGLGAAHTLYKYTDVTVFEQKAGAGGHAHTVTVNYDGIPINVDVGFIVYNTRNYPRLNRFFNNLAVQTEDSDMSFSVHDANRSFEWNGDGAAVFAQRRNIVNPKHFRMLWDILQFNRRAKKDLRTQSSRLKVQSLSEYLESMSLGPFFLKYYLYPMGAAIWSSPISEMASFPAFSFINFFENHGLLDLTNRPHWRTVTNGSHNYVSKVSDLLGDALRLNTPIRGVKRTRDGIIITAKNGKSDMFDHVIIATHGDQVLPILVDANEAEECAFSLFKTQKNISYLHRSRHLMPQRKKAWASWNYRVERSSGSDTDVSVTYWMNRLQNIDQTKPLFVSLNPAEPPKPEYIFKRFEYQHPLYNKDTSNACVRVEQLQGQRDTWFAGAYLGHGFHEDGLRAGQTVAAGILERLGFREGSGREAAE